MANVKDRLYSEYKAKIVEVNTVCGKATNAKVEELVNQLKKIESDYRTVYEREVFASLDTVHDALVAHHFTTISHKVTRDEAGVMTGVEQDDKEVVIDIKKFCEQKGLPMGWYYEMQALNLRLTLKAATELGMSKDEISKINNSYTMDKLAKEIELGKTPLSVSQCVKHLQKVLDSLSEGEGRVNTHDFNFVWMCYGKKSNKNALIVKCSRHSILQNLLMSVFHRVATGKSYGVDCKLNDDAAAPAPVKSKTAKVEVSAPAPVKGKKSAPAKSKKSETVVEAA